jgi:hypothetical protein
MNMVLQRGHYIPFKSFPSDFSVLHWLLTEWRSAFFAANEEEPPLNTQFLFLMRRLRGNSLSEIKSWTREERLYFFNQEFALWKREQAQNDIVNG